jgi:hypothetical protein
LALLPRAPVTSPHEGSGASTEDRAWAWGLPLSLASALAAVALYGFRFGVNNNEFHAVILYKIAFGLRFPGDAMAASLDNFLSPFWWLLGRICRWTDPVRVCAIFFVVGRLLFTIGLSMVIGVLSGRWRLAWLLGSLAALGPGFTMLLPLGADPVMGEYLSQTFVSPGACLLALAFVLGRRDRAGAAILGAVYYVNAMQANFVLGILVLVWLSAPGSLAERLKRTAACVSTVVLVSLPTWLWLLAIARQPAPPASLSGAALAGFASFYYPYHYFWSVKTLTDKIGGVGLPLIVAMLALGRSVDRRDGETRTQPLLLAAATLLGYIGAEVVGSRLWPGRFLFDLHLFRSDVIGFSLAVALAAALAARAPLSVESPTGALRVLVLGALVSGHINASLPLAALLLAVELDHAWPGRIGRLALTGGALLAAGAGAASLLRGPANALLLGCGAGASLLGARPWRPFRALVPLCVLLVCLGKWLDLHPSADVAAEQQRQRDAEISDLARALRHKVDEGALFAIPPVYAIRPELARGVFVSMKDGAAYLWKPGFEIEFLRRLAVLGISYTPGVPWDPDRVEREFENALPASLERLRREGVSHVILPSPVVPNGTACMLRSRNFCAVTLESLVGAPPAVGADGERTGASPR